MPDLFNHIQNVLNTQELYLKFLSIPKTYTIRKIQTSPCKVACPIDTDVKTYLELIAIGQFDKALAIVKKDNPLPGICGRVCIHPCETECNRSDLDEPLAICALKRFLADYELKKGRTPQEPIKITRTEKIAIIGSGPAGLTAANDLIRLGYSVTIFEELPVAGGMLYTGIPAYRLPKDIIKTEIDAIKELGVEIKTNSKISAHGGSASGGKDLNKLKKQGYNAVFIAIGAHKGLKLGISGEDNLDGVIDCISFLRKVNLSEKIKFGKKVIVIGGGNAAIDSARVALRLGSEVHIVYRRSREEMPANSWEIEEAEKEGVKIHYLVSPIKILGKNGKLTAIECIRNKLGEPDSSGRRKPVPIAKSEFKIPADTIIPAISQEPDLSWLPKNHKFKISKWNSFVVDEETLAVQLSNSTTPQLSDSIGIFAGGDCVSGPKTVIEAISAGHKAAKSIHNYLQSSSINLINSINSRVEFEIVPESVGQTKKRICLPTLPLSQRNNFKEVELSLLSGEPVDSSPESSSGSLRMTSGKGLRMTPIRRACEEMAIEEAKRCLRCGFCIECLHCMPDCEKRLVALSTPEELSGILLRAPIDYNQFPLASTPLQGILSCNNSQEIPVLIEPITAKVITILCRGCGECEEICNYSAPKLQENQNCIKTSSIDETACKGCGVCASICQSTAITMNHFSNTKFDYLLKKALLEKKVIAFICNWTYNILNDIEDFAGLKIIRVMCSGSISPALILKAFELGAEGVIGITCPQEQCHYIDGNLTAEKNFEIAKNMLATMGIHPAKARLIHLSVPKSEKLRELLNSFIENINYLKIV